MGPADTGFQSIYCETSVGLNFEATKGRQDCCQVPWLCACHGPTIEPSLCPCCLALPPLHKKPGCVDCLFQRREKFTVHPKEGERERERERDEYCKLRKEAFHSDSVWGEWWEGGSNQR